MEKGGRVTVDRFALSCKLCWTVVNRRWKNPGPFVALTLLCNRSAFSRWSSVCQLSSEKMLRFYWLFFFLKTGAGRSLERGWETNIFITWLLRFGHGGITVVKTWAASHTVIVIRRPKIPWLESSAACLDCLWRDNMVVREQTFIKMAITLALIWLWSVSVCCQWERERSGERKNTYRLLERKREKNGWKRMLMRVMVSCWLGLLSSKIRLASVFMSMQIAGIRSFIAIHPGTHPGKIKASKGKANPARDCILDTQANLTLRW